MPVTPSMPEHSGTAVSDAIRGLAGLRFVVQGHMLALSPWRQASPG
jgi:hypothetical protein